MPLYTKNITLLDRTFHIVSDGKAITALYTGAMTETASSCPVLEEAARQLREYAQSTRQTFELPVNPKGTSFQQAVWKALQTIPYGETRTYGEIAAQIGNPKATRAVGMSCNKNPILMLIPCHRVIGKNGSLTGFGAGLELKRILLDLENHPVGTDILGGPIYS